MYPAGSFRGLGPGAFPSVVAGLVCLVGAVLLVRAALRRSPPPVRPSRPLYVAIAAVAIVALIFAIQAWGGPLFLRFGPAEFTALSALELAIGIALAHSSHARATGMALLGLLLSTVGTDVNTGVTRFTLGVEALSDGIGAIIVLLGLLVVADALVCVASPALFLRIYARLVTAWRPSRIPSAAALAMRLAAALAFGGACYYAYALSNSSVDVGSILVFGVLGVAAKILGWNRFLLCMGFTFGAMLEENIRRTLLLSRGDPWAILRRPLGGTLLVAALVIVVAVAVLSVRRAARAEPN